MEQKYVPYMSLRIFGQFIDDSFEIVPIVQLNLQPEV